MSTSTLTAESATTAGAHLAERLSGLTGLLAGARTALRDADPLEGTDVMIYGDAMVRLVRAGLARDYADAVARYGPRLVHTRCNVITRASFAAVLATPNGV